MPEFQHHFLFCLSQVENSWKSFHKAEVIIHSLAHPCLPKDDLRKPDLIGISGIPLWEVVFFFVSGNQGFGDVHGWQEYTSHPNS